MIAMLRQLSTRDQYDTEINNYRSPRTTFNNEQSPYPILSFKRPRTDNVKQFKREN